MKRFIEDYQEKNFDIIVIGGGITGAAIAYDASSRGLSVALVEKDDFGAATSAVTSKLIHGGFRYLAGMELGLVRESLRERKTLENIAPNFIYPIPNMVTNNNDRLVNRKSVLKLAMILYDLLSFDKGQTWDKSKKIPNHTTLSAKQVIEMEPIVKKEGLTGASVFYDCASIFPERLTLAFIKSAVKFNAVVSNYAKVEDFIIENKKVKGVRVKDLIYDKTVNLKGTITINCTGPWADILLNTAKKVKQDKKIRRSEGIHIITKKQLSKHMITSISPQGRHLFMIPWRGHTIIGTTDKEYRGDPDEYKVTRKSIMELICTINETFVDKNTVKYEDILYTFGGLRPLVEDQTEDVYNSSRKYEIYDNKNDGLDGLITVEGGKYTTSRHLAQRVINKIEDKLNIKLNPMITDRVFLYGSKIDDIEIFLENSKKVNLDFNEETIDYLARIYGTELNEILTIARVDPLLAQPLNHDNEMLAQVVYAIKNEMAVTLKDILFRRTGLGTLGHPGEQVLNKIAKLASKELNWNTKKTEQEIKLAEAKFQIP